MTTKSVIESLPILFVVAGMTISAITQDVLWVGLTIPVVIFLIIRQLPHSPQPHRGEDEES